MYCYSTVSRSLNKSTPWKKNPPQSGLRPQLKWLGYCSENFKDHPFKTIFNPSIGKQKKKQETSTQVQALNFKSLPTQHQTQQALSYRFLFQHSNLSKIMCPNETHGTSDQLKSPNLSSTHIAIDSTTSVPVQEKSNPYAPRYADFLSNTSNFSIIESTLREG